MQAIPLTLMDAEMMSRATWLILAALWCAALGAGFVAGLALAPWLQERALKRAIVHMDRLGTLTLAQLSRAHRLCKILGDAHNSPLPISLWERIEASRDELFEALRRIAEHQDTQSTLRTATRLTVFTVDWTRTPVDAATQLPNRKAFDLNLANMLSQSSRHGQPSGLLLIRIDKSEQLARRYGQDALQQMQQRVGNLLVKSIRDVDLACRLSSELFAVLMPSVSPIAGARHAEVVRSAIREHSFHAGETGPQVLVTASFGYAPCLPDDPANLVFDRAGEALAKSQSTGRNQLHAHDVGHHSLIRLG